MSVSRLGLGLAAIGRPAYITAGRVGRSRRGPGRRAMRGSACAVLDAAYAGGLATSTPPGRTAGRRSSSRAGSRRARRSTTSSSARSGATATSATGTSTPTCTRSRTTRSPPSRAQLGETPALLGDRLGVYHVHSATLDTGVLDDAGCTGAGRAARPRGAGRCVDVRPAAGGRCAGHWGDRRRPPLFTSFQSTWNVLEPSAGPALAEAAAAGARVIVKEAVANGRLAPGGADSPGARRAAELAAELGIR